MSSDQLITDDAKAELTKESIVHLLDLNPMETAVQLMVEDFTIFRQIEMTEYIDNLFVICKGKFLKYVLLCQYVSMSFINSL